ncbi:MAG: MotA/TolQ/ExbB proton channel family protein [Gammaproteobacteria bacterium]
MNLLGVLENGLFALGQVLRFPVMVLLWVCVASACFMAGACFVEFLARRRERAGFNVKQWLRQGPVLLADTARLKQLPSSVRAFVDTVLQRHANHELHAGGIEFLVLEVEEGLKHSLNPSRMLVKVAPSLGLLGTLIPMGVSLASMAAGNLEAMAGQMVVAFTTTIIGLACGTGAYVVNLVRQSWVNELIREQRFIAERLFAEVNAHELHSMPEAHA